jgi:hypothetical protein
MSTHDPHYCLVLDEDGFCHECGAKYKDCFYCGTYSLAYHTHCMSCASPLV